MRRPLLGVALLLAVVAVACGVPEDDEPQALSADQVPFGLLTTTPSTTTPIQVLPPERRADLYFVDSEGLVAPVEREVDNQSPAAVITALLETDSETLDPGLTSNIPPETMLLDISVDDGVITIDLSEQFTSVTRDPFVAAVAQIVFTATDLGVGDLVAFRQEGEPLQVQDENGEAQDEPVSRSDYMGLLAPGAS